MEIKILEINSLRGNTKYVFLYCQDSKYTKRWYSVDLETQTYYKQNSDGMYYAITDKILIEDLSKAWVEYKSMK